MDKEDFLPYEESLSLNELGYNEEQYATFGERNEQIILCTKGSMCGANYNLKCKAPLYQQAFKWFRKNHKLSGEISSHQFYFQYQIVFDTKGCNTCKSLTVNFNTYEEAEIACLQKLIQIVKERKDVK